MRSQPIRMFVEVAPDDFRLSTHLALDPEGLSGAAGMVRQRLREVLGGLSPIMGEDALLKICREVLAEDRPRRR